jgi:two-component system response regulator AtoC
MISMLFHKVRSPRNPLIYVIDRSPSYRKIISSCLSALNYENFCLFENVEECIRQGGSPDIIILENNQGIGKISGLEFFSLYRKRFFHAQFLFLSSNSDLEVAVDAIKMGAYDYIVKSKTGLERLVRRVDQLVNYYRKDFQRVMAYRATALFLGLFSLIFLIAIIIYLR